jgi:hypothetical protein
MPAQGNLHQQLPSLFPSPLLPIQGGLVQVNGVNVAALGGLAPSAALKGRASIPMTGTRNVYNYVMDKGLNGG